MWILLVNLRYAWRMACRQIKATLSIILLIALGMGGVTAVFDPIYSTILSPLPFPQPEQLVRIGGDIPLLNTGTSDFEHDVVLKRIFLNTAAYVHRKIQIRMPDTGKHLDVNFLNVTENFFLKRLASDLLSALRVVRAKKPVMLLAIGSGATN